MILIVFFITVTLFICCYIYTPYDTLVGVLREEKVNLILNQNQMNRLQEGVFMIQNQTYSTCNLKFQIEGTEIVENMTYYQISFPLKLELSDHYVVIQWKFPKTTLLEDWQKRKKGWFILQN